MVLWSAREAFLTHQVNAEELTEVLEGADWTSSFVSAHSIVHLMGWFITPVFWIESHRIQSLNPTCCYLMERFGADWHRHGLPCHKYRWHVWAVTASSVLLPLYVLWWNFMVESSMTGIKHMPAHVYINILLVFGGGVPLLFCCIWIKDFTVALANQLRRELSRGDVTAERVLEFRCGWTKLASLSTGLVTAPISFLMFMSMIIILCTFHAYEVIVQVANVKPEVAFTIFIIGVIYYVMIILLCDIPHRSSEAIRKNFLEVLQTPYHVSKEVRYYELRSFLEIVLWDFPVTTVGGYFDLKRSSLHTIFAVIVTYVIVILQFQLSSHYAACSSNNMSASLKN
ncbi:gustatory and odorant receptor 24-like [Thrips palmi]|uniref:Gustatory receptor n=1 Tax=Thrips palmi TaxID=161013 RepID=A0A6P8YQ31_THRPL|nr:gustatory and odorant receptor 24-like [Thrips palmi]